MEELLKIKDLVVHYETDDGIVKALNNINLSLKEGETLGLVGETGAGKTTLAKAIMKLVPDPPGKIKNGEVIFDGENLISLGEEEMRGVRGKKISMIFQDPMTSLNPVMKVVDQIAEVIQNHEKVVKKAAGVKAEEMLELVGIPKDRANEYPHQFSGGMKQRVIIGMALACNPKLLISDEPTTALDVTIQAQVLEMMADLKNKLNTSMILITHDLGVVAQTCDHVAIIYAGEIIENGTLKDVFTNTKHPYTKGLFGSIPNINEDVKRLNSIPGLMPDPTRLPKGCKFHPRCNLATDICKNEIPGTTKISDNHYVRCFHSN